MHRDLCRGLRWVGMCLLGMLPLVASAQDNEGALSAIKLDRVGSYGGGAAGDISTGWEFDTTAVMRVTDLGVWDTNGDGLDVDTKVKIWNSDGTEVASAVIPKRDGAPLIDGFRYQKIEPVELHADRRYVIAMLYTPAHKDGTISYGGANFSLLAPLKWIRGRHQLAKEFVLPDAPKRSSPDEAELPGFFGPNLRIEESKAARVARNYYRVRRYPQTGKSEVIIVPELADGSHRFDKYKTISLYALPDGKLTQVLCDDLPLGTGDEAFAALAKEVKRIKETKTDDPPIVRVVATSAVKGEDVRRAVGVMESGAFDASKPGRELKEGEVPNLQGTVKQPERGGKHVAADRFKDAGAYVEDRWTGLLWQKDGTESGKMNYFEAFDYTDRLELSGVKGWRLPTPEELSTIFPATYAPFTGTRYNGNECCGGGMEFASYWTSQLDPRLPDYAFLYQWYSKGGANNGYASKNFAYIRAVHNPLPAK